MCPQYNEGCYVVTPRIVPAHTGSTRAFLRMMRARSPDYSPGGYFSIDLAAILLETASEN